MRNAGLFDAVSARALAKVEAFGVSDGGRAGRAVIGDW
jgi:hypothetical protein